MPFNDAEDDSKYLEEWLKETRCRREAQDQNIQFLENSERLDESKLRSLDSTLKKVTAFMKKLKQISNAQSITSLLPELVKLNLSKYLDEIATSVCEAKIKVSETGAVVELCSKVSSIYANFSEILLLEFKKHVPFKKTDKITNASKLRVDLKLLSELVLNGIFKKDGLQLLGSVLSFLINTDKVEHVNIPLLMPLCKTCLYDLSDLLPYKVKQLSQNSSPTGLSSSLITTDQKQTIGKLFKDYYDSLVQHANETRVEMNKVQKSIKRQERTKGDASADDRQKFDQIKQVFDRLLQNANDLAMYIGEEVPPMPEEPSDDEEETIVKKIKKEDGISIWSGSDIQSFYENLADTSRFIVNKTSESADQADDAEINVQEEGTTNVLDSIEAVDMSELENDEPPSQVDEIENVEDEESGTEDEILKNDAEAVSKETEGMVEQETKEQINMSQFLDRLVNAINRELIDKCAIDFVSDLNRKSNRKRLIQFIMSLPTNRLDLLPFVSRFLATISLVIPDVPKKVSHELLTKFRSIADKKYQPPKRGEKKIDNVRIDAKVHLSSFLAELVKFSILPKAEALACLRSLLVDLKSFKVDMLCVMIESMGLFLYRSPESHAKMSVILQVLKEKNHKVIKDPRQQIILDNAYYSVIPPEENSIPLERRPPLEEFIQLKIGTTPGRCNILRRLDWSRGEISEFTIKALSNPTSVRFSDLAKLASLVGLLSDYHDWIGIYVVDSVLEFIRLAMETGDPSFQQRLFGSISYIGELYNYNMCSSAVIFKVLYQLITLALNDLNPIEELARKIIRVRLVCELINTVGEFFLGGSYKKKMDTFLHFFLRVFYEIKSKWNAEIMEELGEFPQDIVYMIDEMLNKWRKGEKFAKNIEDAQQRVLDIEKEYKTKVEEFLERIRDAQDEEDQDDQRRLNCIMEDMDEEEPEELENMDEEEPEEEVRERVQNGSLEELSQQLNEHLDSEDEQIRVHKQRNILPEDEDFMRDFDRMMNETIQMAPISLKAPLNDLEVPPSARQKFERKICFQLDSTKPGTSEEVSVNQPSKDQKSSPQLKMALMTRGKKGTILKAVSMETSENMEETWRRNRQNRERERREIKNLTLGLDERQRQWDPIEEDLSGMSSWPKISGNE